MFYVYATRFNVIQNLNFFTNFFGTKQGQRQGMHLLTVVTDDGVVAVRSRLPYGMRGCECRSLRHLKISVPTVKVLFTSKFFYKI